MNQQQRKYAKERVESILKNKIEALREKHTKVGVQISAEEKLTEFKKGAYKLLPGVARIKRYTHVADIISFNKESEDSFNEKAFFAAGKKLETEANSIVDKIMLGDAEEALRLIEKFAKD